MIQFLWDNIDVLETNRWKTHVLLHADDSEEEHHSKGLRAHTYSILDRHSRNLTKQLCQLETDHHYYIHVMRKQNLSGLEQKMKKSKNTNKRFDLVGG